MDKLLLFSLDYLPNIGGIARMMSSIREQFESNNKSLPVLTSGTRKQSSEKGIIRVTGRRGLQEIKCLIELKKRRVQYVLCARWYPEGVLAYLARRKYIVFTHAAEVLPLRKKGVVNFIREGLKTRVLNKAKHVIANSDFTSSLYSGKNQTIIPLAVNPLNFYPLDKQESRTAFSITEKYVLLTVSRIEGHKGHELVFKAMEKLPDNIKENVVYIIAGTGSYLNNLRKKAENYSISERIQWYGKVDEKELNKLLNSADVFLLCSISKPNLRKVEGFGLSLLEAQACGVPVIGNNSGGIPSAIFDGHGGFIIDAQNSAELAAKIEYVLKSKTAYKEQSYKARKIVIEYYNWKRYYNNLLNVIQ